MVYCLHCWKWKKKVLQIIKYNKVQWILCRIGSFIRVPFTTQRIQNYSLWNALFIALIVVVLCLRILFCFNSCVQDFLKSYEYMQGHNAPNYCANFCVVGGFFLCLFTPSSCNALITFSPQELIDTGLSVNLDFTLDRTDSIPTEIGRPPSALWVKVGNSKWRRRHRERKQKPDAELAIASDCANNNTKPCFHPSCSPTPEPLQKKKKKIKKKQWSYNQRFTTNV